ncbi:MAG: S4 domain-containing protein, partial [Planctomycetota bacterium]
GAAREAAGQFDREVRDKVLPDDLPRVGWGEGWGDGLPLPNLLKELGLCQSTSEARRAIEQGGVRLDGEVKSDAREEIPRPAEPQLIQVGKKRAARLLPD